MRQHVIDNAIAKGIPEGAYPEQWNVDLLDEAVKQHLNLDLPVTDWAKEEGIADEEIRERITKAADEAYKQRRDRNSEEVMSYVEKQIVLQSMDHLWREHIVTLDHLRQVIGWRGLAQRDPLNEYKSEAFQLFDGLVDRLNEQVTSQLMRIEIMMRPPDEPELPDMEMFHADPSMMDEDEMADLSSLALAPSGRISIDEPAEKNPDDPASWGKVGRNEPCPCGSGKKYKHCHGALN
jgi:preprotein translocase subunit SecA